MVLAWLESQEARSSCNSSLVWLILSRSQSNNKSSVRTSSTVAISTKTATVNEDGGNVYQYSCVYQEKEGNISINFASDGKVKNISWMYNPQSEDEYNALVKIY